MAQEKFIEIYQVYFDDHTKKNCDTGWILYNNEDRLNEFFENQVIADIIETGIEGDYFGVFSHDVKDSVSFKHEGMYFSPQSLRRAIDGSVQVYGFHGRRKQENIVRQANNFHPGFTEKMERILQSLGMRLPNKLEKIVLFNLVVASKEFWEAYYYDMLQPAMTIMKDMPELYEDSGYDGLGRPMTATKKARFKKAFGLEHYPFHPFLCERFMSIYLQLNPQWTFKHIF